MNLVQQHDAQNLQCPDTCPCWFEDAHADTLSRAQAHGGPEDAPADGRSFPTCAVCHTRAFRHRINSRGRAVCFDCLAGGAQ